MIVQGYGKDGMKRHIYGPSEKGRIGMMNFFHEPSVFAMRVAGNGYICSRQLSTFYQHVSDF